MSKNTAGILCSVCGLMAMGLGEWGASLVCLCLAWRSYAEHVTPSSARIDVETFDVR